MIANPSEAPKTRKRIRRMLHQGRFPTVRIGERLRVSLAEVEAFETAHRIPREGGAMNTGTISSAPAADPLSHPSFAEIEPATQKGSTKERPLPAEFTRAEWHFRQLVRSERVCLYMKFKAGASGQRVESWEVILPKHRKGGVMPSGNDYPDRETYPKDEDFGTLGWSYISDGAARIAFHARSAAIDGRAQNAPAT